MLYPNPKDIIRNLMRAQRTALSPEEVKEYSLQVCKALSIFPLFVEKSNVMIYAPIHNEVDLFPLIEQFPKKTFLLPMVKGNTMYPGKYREPLVEGKFGILEPQSPIFIGPIQLIIAPGLAFTSFGGRLGQGKGFYDKFIGLVKFIPTIGVGYDFQLLKDLPEDNWDQHLTSVVTPTHTFFCGYEIHLA